MVTVAWLGALLTNLTFNHTCIRCYVFCLSYSLRCAHNFSERLRKDLNGFFNLRINLFADIFPDFRLKAISPAVVEFAHGPVDSAENNKIIIVYSDWVTWAGNGSMIAINYVKAFPKLVTTSKSPQVIKLFVVLIFSTKQEHEFFHNDSWVASTRTWDFFEQVLHRTHFTPRLEVKVKLE